MVICTLLGDSCMAIVDEFVGLVSKQPDFIRLLGAEISPSEERQQPSITPRWGYDCTNLAPGGPFGSWRGQCNWSFVSDYKQLNGLKIFHNSLPTFRDVDALRTGKESNNPTTDEPDAHTAQHS